MAEKIEFELFSSASNAVVARHPGRNYPGVLLQGDTLRCLLAEVEELQEELRSGDAQAAKDVADVLEERFRDLLLHYQTVLAEHGIELPYTDPVAKPAP